MFEVIPAVDIKDGKCVRLYQGRADEQTVYFENPLDAALLWQAKGAKRLHVVDLDGAFEGVPKNIKVVEQIVSKLDIPIQFGGGVRSKKALEALKDVGVDRVVVGTLAYENKELFLELVADFPFFLVLGVDAKDGYLAVRGWTQKTNVRADVFAKEFEKLPIWGFVYTDISRDGTMTSPNFDEIRAFAKNVDKPVIASGGVSGPQDILKLMNFQNVAGVIVGKALYEGKINLEEF